jgi:hypothetical protein
VSQQKTLVVWNKRKTMVHKILERKHKDQLTPNGQKNGVNSGRVRSSFSISGTLVQNLVTSHEWGKGGIVVTRIHLWVDTIYQRLWVVAIMISSRGLLLTMNLLNKGYLVVKLKSSLPMFYGQFHDLVNVMEYKYMCHNKKRWS